MKLHPRPRRLPTLILAPMLCAVAGFSSFEVARTQKSEPPNPGPAQVVDEFYLDTLTQDANSHPAVPLNRQSTFAVFDQLADGSPTAHFRDSPPKEKELLQNQPMVPGFEIASSAALPRTYAQAARSNLNTADLARIVDQFYPQRLIDEADPPGTGGVPLSKNSDFEVIDLLPNGAPRTIVACYTNGSDGAIRVIQAQPNGTRAVVFEFEPNDLAIGGIGCGMKLVDVDGDGVKEIKISFASFRGNTGDWIFRWNGRELVNIGPVTQNSEGTLEPELSNAAFVDFHHDGTLDAVGVEDIPPATNDGSPSGVGYTFYKIAPGGKFVLDRPIMYYSFFFRQKGEPKTETESFDLPPNAAGPFVLTVVNGEKGGVNRLSSGHIVLNGAEVVGPSRFNQQVEFISVPVKRQPNNRLKVRLEGKPGGKILVTVEDTAAVKAAQQQAKATP